MALDANVHYVKFVRGSVQAWEILQETPNKISNDTLYFIYESTNNPTEGKLYLGQKLISGTGGDSGVVNINDIGDIYIDDQALADQQILVYNDTNERWENTSLSTIINTAVSDFTGATSAAAGSAGLVPAPQAGDENKFLSGSGNWATITIPTFDPDVFDNHNNVITLAGISQAAVGTIPVRTAAGIEWAHISAGSGISRTITTMADLEDLIEAGNASENTIYMIASDSSVDSSNQYDEYMVVSGNIELIGTIGDVNLSDYVTKTVFQTAIGNLNDALYGTTSGNTHTPGLCDRVDFLESGVGDLNSLILSAGNTTLVEEINTMNENINILSDRLQWQELNEE